MLLAEAEQACGHPRREGRRKVVDDFHLAPVDERVDEIGDDGVDLRFEALYRLRGEAPGDERTLVVVRRVVLGDHVLFLRRNP